MSCDYPQAIICSTGCFRTNIRLIEYSSYSRSSWLARNSFLRRQQCCRLKAYSELRRSMAHILIIEDDRDIRNVTEFILADAGYSVVSANNGQSGVELAASIQPNLILMDLALPGLNGWEATRQLKADTATQHI